MGIHKLQAEIANVKERILFTKMYHESEMRKALTNCKEKIKSEYDKIIREKEKEIINANSQVFHFLINNYNVKGKSRL